MNPPRSHEAAPAAKPWYEAAFGADYLERYAHRDESEAALAVETFASRAGLAADARVLDLCCGAGRHVRALARRGHRVVGFDLSRDLLGAARGALADFPRASLVHGDKRWIALADGAFDAATHFFTAFGYFERDEENFAVFEGVARVLRPGGWYLFDFLDAEQVLAGFEGRGESASVESFDGGVEVRSVRRLTPDRRRVEKSVRIVRGGGVLRELVESVRLFAPSDLRPALAVAGLPVVEEWGGYDGAPHQSGRSGRWIALCRKAGALRP